MGKNAKLKEKQKWSHEKLHLDNARKLRGIYFIDPEDKEFKGDHPRMLVRNWKHQWLPLCFARSARTIRIVGMVVNPMKTKSKICVYSGSWVNLQDCVWENLYQIVMKTILQEKETIHYSTNNLVHKFIPVPQALENSNSKGSSGQGMGKIWENFGVEPDESQKVR